METSYIRTYYKVQNIHWKGGLEKCNWRAKQASSDKLHVGGDIFFGIARAFMLHYICIYRHGRSKGSGWSGFGRTNFQLDFN